MSRVFRASFLRRVIVWLSLDTLMSLSELKLRSLRPFSAYRECPGRRAGSGAERERLSAARYWTKQHSSVGGVAPQRDD